MIPNKTPALPLHGSLQNLSEMLIEKQWAGFVDRQVCDLFFEMTSKESVRTDISPITQHGPYMFLHTLRNDIFFLTILTEETSPAMVFEFQQLVIDTFLSGYITAITENNIRDNFVLIYQILDEMNHGGFTYTVENNQLFDMISPPSLANKMLDVLSIGSPTTTLKSNVATAAVSKIPWRRDNVKYIKNAVYFDIVESIDAVITPDGNISSAIVHGEVECKCQLSGTPDLALFLKHNPPLQDVSLHRCVRLARYERDQMISFVPPDGEFTLCTYRVDSNINIPLYVRPEFNWTKDKCTFSISFGQRSPVSISLLEDITVIIPIPKSCSAVVSQCNIGNVRTDQLTKTCRWEVKEMPKDGSHLKNDKLAGGQTSGVPMITGTFTLNREVPMDERPTIRVLFNLKKFSATGTTIDGLLIKNVNYQPTRGVRSITKGGKFQVRTL